MALATSSWKPVYSFQAEDITCPACNGKHRPHTNKEGCKKFKRSEHKSAQEPKPAKSDSKKNVKKFIQPDSKLEVPSQPFDPDDEPIVASGPSSGSKDGVRRRREPQIEEDTEIKPEPKAEVKLEEKKEPSPKGTLSLALQRIHDKLQSPTELLKLHLKHYHMTSEQLKRRTSALKLPKEIYDKFDQIPRPKLHPQELRFQEFEVRFLVNLLSHWSRRSFYQSSGKTSIPTFVRWCNFFGYCFCSSKQVWSSDDISSSRVLWNLSAESKIQCCRSSFHGNWNGELLQFITAGTTFGWTPWPNRAEAAICMFKKQVSLMLISLKDDPLLANITYKQLLRQVCILHFKEYHGNTRWCYTNWISVWKKTCRYNGDWAHESCAAHYRGPCSWETDWSTKVAGDAKVSRGKAVWWPSKRHCK